MKKRYYAVVVGKDISVFPTYADALKAFLREAKALANYPRYRPRQDVEPTTPELRARLVRTWQWKGEILRTKFVRKDDKPFALVLLQTIKPYSSPEECLADLKEATLPRPKRVRIEALVGAGA